MSNIVQEIKIHTLCVCALMTLQQCYVCSVMAPNFQRLSIRHFSFDPHFSPVQIWEKGWPPLKLVQIY